MAAAEGRGVPAEAEVRAQRLNALMEARLNPDTGRPYTNAEVARKTNLSPSLIAGIRRGEKPNPTMDTAEALADLFGVTVEYFSTQMSDEHQRRIIAGLQLLDAAESAGVEALFARTIGLSSENLATVTAVIESMRKAQGLDDPET